MPLTTGKKTIKHNKSKRKATTKIARPTTCEDPCWCGNPSKSKCCAPILLDHGKAETPEALMRSRYSGFVTQNANHLARTWHPQTRPAQIRFQANQQWLGLKVIRSEIGFHPETKATQAIVEFVARSKIDGRGNRHHEISEFAKLNGLWLYIAGEIVHKDVQK